VLDQIKIKNKKKFSAVIFFKFLVIKALDPYWISKGTGQGDAYILVFIEI
jgi:hypothetical protein